MLSKTFAFNKIQKTIVKIEDDLNGFLKSHSFKFATQNESSLKGKFVVTIFADKGKSSIRAKVFKNQHIDQLDVDVNNFLLKHPMKFATQTFVGSSVYTIIFYDASSKQKSDGDKSSDNQDDQNVDSQADQTDGKN